MTDVRTSKNTIFFFQPTVANHGKQQQYYCTCTLLVQCTTNNLTSPHCFAQTKPQSLLPQRVKAIKIRKKAIDIEQNSKPRHLFNRTEYKTKQNKRREIMKFYSIFGILLVSTWKTCTCYVHLPLSFLSTSSSKTTTTKRQFSSSSLLPPAPTTTTSSTTTATKIILAAASSNSGGGGGNNRQSRLEGNTREPTAEELAIIDEMITKLADAKPYELPNAVSAFVFVLIFVSHFCVFEF